MAECYGLLIVLFGGFEVRRHSILLRGLFDWRLDIFYLHVKVVFYCQFYWSYLLECLYDFIENYFFKVLLFTKRGDLFVVKFI